MSNKLSTPKNSIIIFSPYFLIPLLKPSEKKIVVVTPKYFFHFQLSSSLDKAKQ